MLQLILLFLYVDNVVIFSYDVDGVERLLGVLETFCQSIGLIVNMDKTNFVVMRTVQPHQYPILTYTGEHVQFV